ncbi:hypothetical protein TrST_g1030 [Triparma strigata]|uniref:Phosphodiesterase n=1 Tax=Triparma strigata TaxID=1606541 RepID=A0A9W6ZUA6_9STRA|nr:hypothetical protein TrST_g1030 [Triparma strigata]
MESVSTRRHRNSNRKTILHRKTSSDMKAGFLANFENIIKDEVTAAILKHVEGEYQDKVKAEDIVSGRRMSWTQKTENLVSKESESLVSLPQEDLIGRMGEILQNNVDQMKLLTFSNAIMMETNLSQCLAHLIDAIFDATSSDAVSMFILDDSMQHMEEFKHNAYKDDRDSRTMSARTGIGQEVLTSEDRMIYVSEMDESKYKDLEIRPSFVVDGDEYKYPCVLYTAVYDHTGRPLAVVEISQKKICGMNDHQIKVARAISLIGANAMRSARLHEEMTPARRHSDALLEISQALSNEMETNDVIDRILKVARDVVNPQYVSLYLVDEETGDLQSTNNSEMRIPYGEETLEGFVAANNEIHHIDDVKASSNEFKLGDTGKHAGIVTKNVICAPVADSDGKVLAVMSAFNKTGSEGLITDFGEEDELIVQSIADSAGVALHKANLLENIKCEQKKNKSLISVMKAVNQSKDNMDALVNNLVAVAYDIIEVDKVTLYLVDDTDQTLMCTVSGFKDLEGNRYSFGKNVAGRVASSGETLTVQDASAIPAIAAEFEEKGYTAKNLLCMPIRDHRNKLVAVIELLNKKNNGAFTFDDENILAAFSEEVASALKRVVLEKAFQHKSDSGGDDHVVGLIEQYSNKVIKQSSSARAPVPAQVSPKGTSSSLRARRGGSVAFQGKLKIMGNSPGKLDSQGNLTESQSASPRSSAFAMTPGAKENVFEQLNSWEFDVLMCDKSELVVYGQEMLNYYHTVEEFHVKPKTMEAFLTSMESNYRDNSFHSLYHAYAVMHASFMMLTKIGADQFLTSKDVYAVLIGSLCHDLDHPGTTNEFQKSSRSSLALLYNDKSVLENHHAATCFKIMSAEGTNILSELNNEDFMHIRKLIIEVILKTDMVNHFDMVKNMQALADKQDKDEGSYFSIDSEHDRFELCSLVVHCADLSNPAYPSFEMTKNWCQRVCQEFSEQVELEKKAGIPVTSFMEGLNNEHSIAKLQVGFVNYVILPLWKAASLLLPKAERQCANCVANVKCWQRIVDSGGESPTKEVEGRVDDDEEEEE